LQAFRVPFDGKTTGRHAADGSNQVFAAPSMLAKEAKFKMP
jgi:hypothetical protein